MNPRAEIIRVEHRGYTSEEWARREWIMRPIVIRQYGGKSYSGFYNRAEEHRDAVYRRHLRWLQRQTQVQDQEGADIQFSGWWPK